MTFDPATHQKQGLAFLKKGKAHTPESMAADVRALRDYVYLADEHGAYPFVGVDPGTQGGGGGNSDLEGPNKGQLKIRDRLGLQEP